MEWLHKYQSPAWVLVFQHSLCTRPEDTTPTTITGEREIALAETADTCGYKSAIEAPQNGWPYLDIAEPEVYLHLYVDLPSLRIPH